MSSAGQTGRTSLRAQLGEPIGATPDSSVKAKALALSVRQFRSLALPKRAPTRRHAVTSVTGAFLAESCRRPLNGMAVHFGRLFNSYLNSYIAFKIA
jgi:hypothetical protein